MCTNFYHNQHHDHVSYAHVRIAHMRARSSAIYAAMMLKKYFNKRSKYACCLRAASDKLCLVWRRAARALSQRARITVASFS